MKVSVFIQLGFYILGGLMSVSPFSYSQKIILIADPRVLAVTIQENKDPFIDLRHQDILIFGSSPEIPNNTNYTKMRKSVYDRLVKAQSLLPKGYKFCLYEAYRSLALQQQIFSEKYERLRALHPGWSHEHVFTETTKLVSPVINLDGSKNIPPHSTGGAIDVYLVDREGVPIDMGIHPKDWMEDLEGKLSQTDSTIISADARRHRKMMGEVLSKVGFINYPTEYWHWSFGDRYWAYLTKSSTAVYKSI